MPCIPASRLHAAPPSAQLINQGYALFVSIPPHADPVAVRLTTAMLRGDASCPKGGGFKTSEKVMFEGKIHSVKTWQLFEAVVLIAVEQLFNASDCATGETVDSDMTCRLLRDYDVFMQAGGPTAAPEVSEQLEGFGDLPLSFLGASGDNAVQEGVEDLMLPGTAEISQVAGGSDTPNEEPTEPQDVLQKTSEPPVEAEPVPVASETPVESTGRSERVRVYGNNAAAAAVATARLGMSLVFVAPR